MVWYCTVLDIVSVTVHILGPMYPSYGYLALASTPKYNIGCCKIFALRSQHGQTPIKWLMVNVDMTNPYWASIIDGYFSPIKSTPPKIHPTFWPKPQFCENRSMKIQSSMTHRWENAQLDPPFARSIAPGHCENLLLELTHGAIDLFLTSGRFEEAGFNHQKIGGILNRWIGEHLQHIKPRFFHHILRFPANVPPNQSNDYRDLLGTMIIKMIYEIISYICDWLPLMQWWYIDRTVIYQLFFILVAT